MSRAHPTRAALAAIAVALAGILGLAVDTTSAPPASAATNPLIWPASGPIVSWEGLRFHPIDHVWKQHNGIDISAGTGDPVVAAAKGTVTFAQYNGSAGLEVKIDHGNGYQTRYLHLSAESVFVGQQVAQGTQIGQVGTTGASTGPHLHFELRHNGSASGWDDPIQGTISYATRGAAMGLNPPGFPSPNPNPVGNLEAVWPTDTGVRVVGWASDPDTSAPISVHVYVAGADGYFAGTNLGPAGGYRPDVGNHGFDSFIGTPDGAFSVCAYGINVGDGGNSLIGCKDVTVSTAPVGNLEVVRDEVGRIHVSGWAVDPRDPGRSLDVHVYDNGTGIANLGATPLPRPDVAAIYGGSPDTHGFASTITNHDPPNGANEVCAYGINTSNGRVGLLDCETIQVDGNTVGAIDLVRPEPGVIRVSGWAADPDTATPVNVHIYVDGNDTANADLAVTADLPRGDLAAAYPWLGANGPHGFDATLPNVNAGSHEVCAYAINAGGTAGAANSLLGCRDVTIEADPVGVFELAQPQVGQVRVVGWALDPNTDAPVRVDVWENGGAGIGSLTADKARSDIPGAFPGWGGAHGFAGPLRLTPGTHDICAYAINAAGTPGGNRLLGCKVVTIDGAPGGAVNVTAQGDGTLRAEGWSIDPATAAPNDVHVYVNGVGRANVDADLPKPGLAYFFPWAGSNHGYDVTVAPVGTGPQQVCAYGIDVAGGGGNSLLGCVTV